MGTTNPQLNTPFAAVCPGCSHSLLNHRTGRCIVQRSAADNRICGCAAHLAQPGLPYHQVAPTQRVVE